MIEFNTLEHTSLDILHSSFVEAFSDYQVEIDQYEMLLTQPG